MSEHFDVAVLGMGPGGEVAAGRLLKAGKKVAVIERELIGGECAYWACIPSKTVLRPAEARTEVQRAAGVSGAQLDWTEISKYRDYMIRNLDDSAQVDGYARHGAVVIKGEARITGPGQIKVDDRELTMNTKIRLITRIAFGFTSPDALIALAMLSLGGHKPVLPGRT